MTTDNRTNEPKQTKTKSSQDFVFTEAQVEAAAKAIERIPHIVWNSPTRQDAMTLARAALVAAQGAAPVPSSGIDEEKLAEVIGKARTTSVRDSDGVKSVVMESNEQIARAVAEWLRGQGR